MSQNSLLYCICRSKDGKGFMIGCDKCEEWFHGKCIGFRKKKAAERIDKYYCASCIKADPSLKIVYGSSQPPTESEKKTVTIKHKPIDQRESEKNVFTFTIAGAKCNIIVTQKPQMKAKLNKRRFSNLKKLRHEAHFILRCKKLKRAHSLARLKMTRDLNQLENDKRGLEQSIKNLRLEREKMELNVQGQAKKSHKENDDSVITSGVVPKTPCVICSKLLTGDGFNHWIRCYRKNIHIPEDDTETG